MHQVPSANRKLNMTRLTKLAGASAAVILIAGCGSGSNTGRSSRAANASDQGMLQFARCMRAHGIAMADPFHRPGHAGLSIDLPEQGPATTSAYATCGHFLLPTIEAKQAGARAITASMRLGLIRYAQCMRTHGIPMLDPTAQGSLSLGNVPGLGNGSGRYSPQFHSADRDCRRLLPAGVHDDGTGP
jgi:hypothetical protein